MMILWGTKAARLAAIACVTLALGACQTMNWGNTQPAQPQAGVATLENIAAGSSVRVEGEAQPVTVADYYLAATGEACIRYVADRQAYRVACRAGSGPFQVTGNDLTGRTPAYIPAPLSALEPEDETIEAAPIAAVPRAPQAKPVQVVEVVEEQEDIIEGIVLAPMPRAKPVTSIAKAAPSPEPAPRPAPAPAEEKIAVKREPVVTPPAPKVIAKVPSAPPAPAAKAAANLAPYDESKNSERAP